MAKTTTRVSFHVMNCLLLIFGVALVCTSIWFFVQVYEFTSLRNYNHYLLDYTVYWPQAIPWLFFFSAVFTITAGSFGVAGNKKKNRRMVHLSIGITAFSIFALLAVAIIGLVFADTNATDRFVTDTIWDVYFQSKIDPNVAQEYGNLEKKYHCCGAESPRDYKNWKNDFPQSCCDTYYHTWYVDSQVPYHCDFTNKLANERLGCTMVAGWYARLTIKILSAACIFMAFLAVIALSVGIKVVRSLKYRAPSAQVLTNGHQIHELDSSRGLL